MAFIVNVVALFILLFFVFFVVGADLWILALLMVFFIYI